MPPSSPEDKFVYQLLIDFVPFEQCLLTAELDEDMRSPDTARCVCVCV